MNMKCIRGHQLLFIQNLLGESDAKHHGQHEKVKEGEAGGSGGAEAAGSRWSDYVDDLVYLLRNRTFVLTTLAFTMLTFFTGSLSWWGPIFMEDAIRVAHEYGGDPSLDKENVAFVFGVVLSVAGVLGLALGSGLSYKLRERLPWVDPVICGLGLLASAPFCLAAVGFARESPAAAFGLVFVGEIFLNMNWAIIVDISLVSAVMVIILKYRNTVGVRTCSSWTLFGLCTTKQC